MMAAADMMRYPPLRRRANDGLLAARMALRPQLLDSGRAFMLLGTLVLTWWHHHLAAPEHELAAFIFWLLGAGLAMLALVAGQFPRLAAAGAALARALAATCSVASDPDPGRRRTSQLLITNITAEHA
ncbi:hypothetical protein HU200_055739 [Digitaria exilis]|uniref:Uncharacterized protein n=1 Tax=Digitaria exilis TaxID=1010633 RepID=A0A835AFF4_9POAL|nr:hypothetical protein HU200_055739 [Digitaria exilis]